MKKFIIIILIFSSCAIAGEYKTVKIQDGGSGHLHKATHQNTKTIYMSRYFTDDELPLDFTKDELKWVMKVTPFYLDFYNEKHKTSYTRKSLLNDAINAKVFGWAVRVDIPKDIALYGLPDTPEVAFILYHFGLNETLQWLKDKKKVDKRIKQSISLHLDEWVRWQTGEYR